MGVWGRDSMRGPDGGAKGLFGLTPARFIGWLIGINVAIFLLPSLTGWGFEQTDAGGHRLGGYSSQALLQGRIWGLLTYPFVHRDILHIALNMLGLYFLGRQVAQALGALSFLALYFGGGVAGALLETAVRGVFGGPTHIIGASASVSAVMAMFVALMPAARLQIFPLPFLIRAPRLLWFFLIFNALCGLLTLRSGGPAVAYFAHCGGALYGLAHARIFRPRVSTSGPTFSFANRKHARPGLRYRIRPQDPKIIDAQFTDEPAATDYNAVLDKINRSGIASLTARERRILEQAGAQLGRDSDKP